MFKLNYPNKEDNLSFVNINKPLKLPATEEYKNELSNNFKNFIIQPKNTPMVCPPNMWSVSSYGGYLENTKIKDDVITGSVKYHNHQLRGEGKIKLYSTINYFNQIKFQINKSLLFYLMDPKAGKFLLDSLVNDELVNSNISIFIFISIKLAYLFKDFPNFFEYSR
jgi:hypothetical protein